MPAGRKTRTQKKASLPPRRLRMNRERRLVAAVAFVRGCNGKNLIRRYARWFGVDVVCAALELQTLGARIDPADIARVRAIQREKGRIGRQRNEQRAAFRAAPERSDDAEFEPFIEGGIEPPTGNPY